MMDIRSTMPASPSAADKIGQGRDPSEYNPDLALAKLMEEMVKRLGTPSIISKTFAVNWGIAEALDGSKDTMGIESPIRCEIYRRVAANSVNIDGTWFERIMAYAMKPRYIIQGTPYGQNAFEEKQSIFGRIANFVTGNSPQKTNTTPPQNGGGQY